MMRPDPSPLSAAAIFLRILGYLIMSQQSMSPPACQHPVCRKPIESLRAQSFVVSRVPTPAPYYRLLILLPKESKTHGILFVGFQPPKRGDQIMEGSLPRGRGTGVW
ncbi:hypothetical protein F4778DRAFT_744615 [Xylariomycetidae sp. FL2044]|nr:hypothetical protein F4778DRAFT_744615 [Xylariomycetidae sp. FL2044]